jgi:dolichol-phosphate mannosyltransferase
MSLLPLQIAIPVYNESENIVGVLEEIEAKISTPYCINIIYDFEEDNTLPVVNKFIQDRGKQNINLVKNHYGKGALNAIKTGFEAASDGVVLVVMADSSDDLGVVDNMYEQINRGYDIVCGSRYIKGGKQIGGPRFKGFLSRMAGVSLHWLTGIPTHDPTNSFKMYRKSVLDGIAIESSGGFEIGMEIVVKAFLKGRKITEVPAIWRDRTAGTSRFKLRQWLPKYMRWYWFAVTRRPRRKGTPK